MNETEKTSYKNANGIYWADNVWKASWTYIRTVVDTVREPFLILDGNLRVIAANETFYRTFRVPIEETEKKLLYELGDGQWNIPDLRNLLEDILPKDTFFKGFQVSHVFPGIGQKRMLLNARRVYQNENNTKVTLEPIIFLAIEDVTEFTNIAEKLALKTIEYELKMVERTNELEKKISELTDLNKTVLGFNGIILQLKTVIKGLKRDVALLG